MHPSTWALRKFQLSNYVTDATPLVSGLCDVNAKWTGWTFFPCDFAAEIINLAKVNNWTNCSFISFTSGQSISIILSTLYHETVQRTLWKHTYEKLRFLSAGNYVVVIMSVNVQENITSNNAMKITRNLQLYTSAQWKLNSTVIRVVADVIGDILSVLSGDYLVMSAVVFRKSMEYILYYILYTIYIYIYLYFSTRAAHCNNKNKNNEKKREKKL